MKNTRYFPFFLVCLGPLQQDSSQNALGISEQNILARLLNSLHTISSFFLFLLLPTLSGKKSVISSQNALGHRRTRISSDKPQQQGTIHHRPSNLDTEGFVKTPLVSENIEN